MKRIIIHFTFIIICFVLQSTILKYIALAGVCPNLMIIIPAITGFLNGQKEGIYVGFLTGFIYDLFYCDVIGLNALIFLLIGFCAGFFKDHYNKDEIIIPLLIVFAGDFTYGFTNYVFNFLLRSRLDIGYYMNNIIIPEIVYTLFITILIYKIFLFIHKIMNKKYERRVKRYVF